MRQTSPIIGTSQPMSAIRELISKIADSDATVLINGESGTGKELVAQALHYQSRRADANFVPLNCAAIPKDLMESELFGHRKGAFTGALADRVGRFELAHGGTLFLDEIGDLSLDMQVKLLRVLQERVVDPVGSTRPVSVDVRVVAATHRDLEVEIAAGRFREDLYYRLNVLPLITPPLRDRRDDVPLLAKFYAERFAGKGKPVTFTSDFLEALKAYDWPGNVRELSNLVHRFSALFAGQRLALNAVPAPMLPKGLKVLQEERRDAEPEADILQMFPAEEEAPTVALADTPLLQDEDNHVEEIIMLAQGMEALPPEGISLKERMAEIERGFIEQALERADGNVSKTARMLNLQRTTLIEKIDKYRLRSA
ncbi:MAG: sigma-54 dependent transcriptional regulator [Burkholderiales bacterium]|jgi:sigma-54 specific flagellar transcriptional regulator A|nr:sigma-54 dependent transcriptional regulator [Burkholderiales bacterium]